MDGDPAGNTILFDLLLLLFFTLMNAYFAGAEMAVVSVNKNRIRSLAEEGNKKAKVIEGLFDDSTKFLSTIQVAITFAGFYSSASAAAGLSPVLAQWMSAAGIPYSSQIAHNGVTLVLMFFNLVFGELVPKRIALQKAEAFSMLTVMPIHYISIILSPFIKLLSVSTKLVLRILHMKTEDQEEAVTEEEIKALLKMGNESGTFDDDEREMIDSVFAFDDRTAREIMVPRRDVVTIDIEEPFEEIIDEILETRHNRIPVYEENIDNIIGVLHVKDVMIELRKNSPEQMDIRGMLHEAYFVPETKEADELFRTMQAERRHMAILVDEYGGFSGIVTIEDLVEEIMGDINEEYEEVVPEIEAVNEDEYRLDGGILIDDVNEELGLKLETENYDTLSGFLIEKLGHIPAKDDRDVIEEGNLVFTVEEVKDNRITQVSLKILPVSEAEEEEKRVKGDAVSMKKLSIEEELRNNSYPGRGIIIGKTPDGKKAVTAYFIMGRSENSRNRIFVEDGEGIRTQAFDPSKLVDPSLIIYAPVRVLGNKTIVTNGDQTDTIYEGMDKQLTLSSLFGRGSSSRTDRTTRRASPASCTLRTGHTITRCPSSRATMAVRTAAADIHLHMRIRRRVKDISSTPICAMAIRSRVSRASRS